MRHRFLTALLISISLWFSGLAIAPNAAAMTSIKLSNLSYEPCAGQDAKGSVSGGVEANWRNARQLFRVLRIGRLLYSHP